MSELRQSRSLAKRRDALPATIRDAMNFTKGVGVRYLWVDSLCLVQDNHEELSQCCRLMATVYREAEFTIVAAAGDAHSGLPGVSPNTRNTQLWATNVVAGVKLTVIRGVNYLLDQSRYSSRAWTMQEEAVSLRRLYFVDGALMFQCQGLPFDEILDQSKYTSEHQTWSLDKRDISELQESMNFNAYATMIGRFKERVLTYESNTLRAAEGMLELYCSMKGEDHFQGLLVPLERSILFCSNSEYGSSSLSEPTKRRRREFPSYSWTGWRENHVGFWTWEYDLYEEQTSESIMAIAKQTDGLGSLRVWIVWYSCHKGQYEILNPKQQTDGIEHYKKPNSTESILRSHVDFQKFSVESDPDDIDALKNSNDFGRPYPLLCFWTVCINISTTDLHKFDQDDSCYTCYQGDYDQASYFIILDENSSDQMLEIAFISRKEKEGVEEIFGIVLKWDSQHDDLAERCGIAMLSKAYYLLNNPKHGPRWKKIFLA